MTQPIFVLHPGWSFGASDMQPLARALEAGGATVVSSEREVDDEPAAFIGVGHSLGFARLTQRPRRARALVGIGAFFTFPQTGLDAMRTAFARDPLGVVRAFRRRCGERSPAGMLTFDALQAARDLDDLMTLDVAAPAVPLLLLYGGNDRIIDPPHQAATVARAPQARVHTREGASHLLGIDDADWCAERILDFAKALA